MMHRLTQLALALLGIMALALPAIAFGADEVTPENASGTRKVEAALGWEYMAATAHPLATQAANHILDMGGSATDAAIAAQMVLNVVEPQSSGIGGGGFLMFYNAETKAITGYDGRETAPADATPTRFLDKDGKPRPFDDVVAGGLSVGTPGLIRMLWEAHKAHGTMEWASLLEPAITLAKTGFPVSERVYQNMLLAKHTRHFPATAALYLNADGTPKAVGSLITNLALGEALESIALHGPTAFYEGALASNIAQAVQKSPVNPANLTASDIASYQAKQREVPCITYRTYKVCGMGPPTSGGITLLQALKMLEPTDLGAMEPLSAPSIHVITEATRLAFADRNAYIADPDFVKVPVAGMLDSSYLTNRATLIRPDATLPAPAAGQVQHAEIVGIPAPVNEPPATTHLSIVDRLGNTVALTSSIEYAFGSGLTVEGFALNNQLTDFSFTPEVDGKPVANRVEGGKRPRSSMAPTFVFDEQGTLILALGSAGGARIIPYVLETLIAVLDWQMDIQDAIALPHFADVGSGLELEEGTSLAAQSAALTTLGHTVRLAPLTSGIQAIHLTGDGLVGAADPRREGVPAGY